MRRCIFCRARVNSVEHVWPKWAMELVTSPDSRGHVSWSRGAEPPKTFLANANSVDLQVRHLCKGCNNGWLSQLEGDVKSVISAIILDMPVVLYRNIQRIIAAWCFKVALIAQCGGNNWFYSNEEATQFRTTLSPPESHTAIWLAKHTGEVTTFVAPVHLYPQLRPTDAPAVGYITTAAISHLVIQVMSVRRDAGMSALRVSPGPWHDALIPVWPSQDEIRWPPNLTLDRAGLHALSARFSGGPVS